MPGVMAQKAFRGQIIILCADDFCSMNNLSISMNIFKIL